MSSEHPLKFISRKERKKQADAVRAEFKLAFLETISSALDSGKCTSEAFEEAGRLEIHFKKVFPEKTQMVKQAVASLASEFRQAMKKIN